MRRAFASLINVYSRPVVKIVIPDESDTSMFNPDETRNEELLLHMGRRGHFPPSESIDLGTHYDVIDYLWSELNRQLDGDCRWIVAFRPALVRPDTGVAFAVGGGTNYWLRLSGSVRQAYISDLQAKALSDAEEIGVKETGRARYLAARSGESVIGPSWVDGWWLSNDHRFIVDAFEQAG